MSLILLLFLAIFVALRKESVDRNYPLWYIKKIGRVALRKESVDRNLITILHGCASLSRSPQGERG